MSNFRVGQKVVFVGYPAPAAAFHGGKQIKRVAYLDVGSVYTVLGISIRDRYAKGKWAGPSISVGVKDPQYGEVWHHHSGFRPVATRKTSIEIFRRMLNPQKLRTDA